MINDKLEELIEQGNEYINKFNKQLKNTNNLSYDNELIQDLINYIQKLNNFLNLNKEQDLSNFFYFINIVFNKNIITKILQYIIYFGLYPCIDQPIKVLLQVDLKNNQSN